MWHQWRTYVPVAQRRVQAVRFAATLAKKENRALTPVKPEGRAIAQSFWGRAWCDNLERYSDFENRLPRGRTYVRNGSVIDLQIRPGEVQAIVSGSEIYRVTISIRTLAKAAWKNIKQDCSRSIASLIDLLRGRFGEGVMQRLTRPGDGLFPRSKEIEMKCTCPDWAGMCKHVAATLYGIGTRLDAAPELLFTLRNVDHLELISQAVAAENLEANLTSQQGGALAGNDLEELFGIELDSAQPNSAQANSIEANTTRANTTRANTTQANTTRAKSARAKPGVRAGAKRAGAGVARASDSPPRARKSKSAPKKLARDGSHLNAGQRAAPASAKRRPGALSKTRQRKARQTSA